MTRDEYERLKRQAEEDYRKNVEALDRVFRMSQLLGEVEDEETSDNEQPRLRSASLLGIPESPSTSPERSLIAKGDVTRAVNETVRRMRDRFTILDIVQDLGRHQIRIQKGSIRPVLRKLEQDGVIKIVTQGIGRAPTIYEKEQNGSE
jgi:hypothetical protein